MGIGCGTFLYLNGIELCRNYDIDAAEDCMNGVAQQAALTIEEIAQKLASFATD